MQKIYLEKAIDLNHQLKELISLSVDESINYKIEHEGIRAIGNLIIKGEYKNIDKQNFEEILELDILATFDKILDQRDFSIKVEDFDYVIRDGNILIKIDAGVHGVIAGEDRYIRDNPIEHIESLIRENDPITVDARSEEVDQDSKEDLFPIPPRIEVPSQHQSQVEARVEVSNQKEMSQELVIEEHEVEVKKTEKVISKQTDPVIQKTADDIDEQLEKVVYSSKTRPIFQDTSDSVGTYYLYLIKENDTYQSIAERYCTDEFVIKEYNQNRDLDVGSVLIIPYVP